jgi:hypothetical protein
MERGLKFTQCGERERATSEGLENDGVNEQAKEHTRFRFREVRAVEA